MVQTSNTHKQQYGFHNMLYERINDHPVLVSPNYASCYEHPLVENPDNEWTWMEFFGTGVPIETHPLMGWIKKLNLDLVSST